MSITDLSEYRRKRLEREIEDDPVVREWWEYLKDRLTWAGVFRNGIAGSRWPNRSGDEKPPVT